MRKKLLVVGSNSIHVYNFIALVKEHFEDVLLVTNEINTEEDVSSVAMDFSLGLQSLKTISKMRSITAKFQPSVVHIHQANTYAFLTVLALKSRNSPLVLTAWGSDVLINPQKSIFLKIMLKYVLNQIAVLTADSDAVLNEAKGLVKKELRIHNINFGLEIPECNRKKENIIYSNRLHKPLYNIDKIIISFGKFFAFNTDWKLIIAGSGEDTSKLEELVNTLGLQKNVEFIGWVDSKTNYEYYCRSKIYVSIPKSDSVSLSLVEGIGCGCVPFVSNLAANKELINKDIGFIVDDLDNMPFEKYIEIDQKLFSMRKEEIKQYFSKSFNREKYLDLYWSLDEN